MHRLRFFILALVLLSATAYTQTTPADPRTLQTLLDEVRQLRQDFRTMAVSIERAQILLHRLQIQEAAVGRAQQRLDDARSRLTATESHPRLLPLPSKLTKTDKAAPAASPSKKRLLTIPSNSRSNSRSPW